MSQIRLVLDTVLKLSELDPIYSTVYSYCTVYFSIIKELKLLVENSSNQAARPGFLCISTHRRSL